MGWSYMYMLFKSAVKKEHLLAAIRLHNSSPIEFVGEPIDDLQMAHLVGTDEYILIFGNAGGGRITANFLRAHCCTVYHSLPDGHQYENVLSIDFNGNVVDVSYHRDGLSDHPKRLNSVEIGSDALEFLMSNSKRFELIINIKK
jgi:hypothetical protein